MTAAAINCSRVNCGVRYMPSGRSESVAAAAARVVAAEAETVLSVGSGAGPLPQAVTTAKSANSPAALRLDESTGHQTLPSNPKQPLVAGHLYRHRPQFARPCARLRTNFWSGDCDRPLLVALKGRSPRPTEVLSLRPTNLLGLGLIWVGCLALPVYSAAVQSARAPGPRYLRSDHGGGGGPYASQSRMRCPEILTCKEPVRQ
jgi:hypothetical protein